MEKDEIIITHPIPHAVLVPEDEVSAPKYMVEDTYSIGRDSNNSLIVTTSLRISRKHCIIEKSKNHEFTITDFSNSGTYVNGQLVGKRQSKQLQHRDIISLASEISYKFYIHISLAKKNIEDKVNSSFQEQMLHLANSHSQDMIKLNEEMDEMESEKNVLKEEMNERLKAQEDLFQQEYLKLTQLMTTTVEQKDEMERKLREMEEKSKIEKEKLMEEVDNKMSNLTKKVEDVQKLKEEMELKYQQERTELEMRCEAEIEELKGKLIEYKQKQELLQGETKEIEQKLSDTKMVLIESEMEQQRLLEEKVEVEMKMGEEIKNLIKESSNKDELLKNMQQLLQEKDEAANKMRQEMEEYLEEQLQCSICAEVFIEPTVLTCGHMFCKVCIEEWKAKKKICPMCRTKITSCLRLYTVDAIVNKNVAIMSSEAKERRQKLIEERTGITQVPAKKRKCRHHVNASTSTSTTANHAAPPTFTLPQTGPNYLFHLRSDTGNTAPILRFMMGGPNMSDPFAWGEEIESRIENRTIPPPIVLDDNWMGPQQPPVSVAAIDLTHNIDIPHPRLRFRNEAATSTTLNDTVDLTNL